MNIFVSGSLAYDRIMDFQGHFSDHILPDRIHIINISFIVNGVAEKFGGTAGNIAYALALLGERPTILATIGHDYQRYFEWLEKNRLSWDSIKIVDTELTAGAYITTDLANNQITGFNPGAMKYPSLFDFDGVGAADSIGIIAPGNLEDMVSYARVYKAKGITYIFDPGQSLPALSGEQLRECIDGAKLLVSNDYELGMIMNKTELDREGLLNLTETIIATRGEMGSVIYSRSGEVQIPAIRPQKLVDPTGAGDAYRGGLIKGLIQGKDIVGAAMMGTVCSTYAIEHYGTQEYHFTEDEFRRRFEEHRGRLSF